MVEPRLLIISSRALSTHSVARLLLSTKSGNTVRFNTTSLCYVSFSFFYITTLHLTKMELPVLDLKDTSPPDPKIAKDLIDSVSRYGFVFVKNSSGQIPPSDIDSVFQLSKQFFKSPAQDKTPFRVNSGSSGKNSGWFEMHTELLDPEKQATGDFKEAFNMNEFRNGKAQQPLPPILKANEDRLNAFIDHCYRLCLLILRYFAAGLEIDSKAGGSEFFQRFHDRSGPSGSVFRLLYYPAMSQAYDNEKDIRAGAHSDYGSITLLFQRPGQPGLEILTDDNSQTWYPVPVNPTNEPELPILVNVGDLLSYWTNWKLKSAVHRVVFPENSPGKDRYSIAYFCHPVDDAPLLPVPSRLVQEDSGTAQDGSKKVLTAKQHLENRLAASYAWDGKS